MWCDPLIHGQQTLAVQPFEVMDLVPDVVRFPQGRLVELREVFRHQLLRTFVDGGQEPPEVEFEFSVGLGHVG